jgi:lipopolysaccharide/colanic/teichoic acid biosynthesis glycosyltransferase
MRILYIGGKSEDLAWYVEDTNIRLEVSTNGLEARKLIQSKKALDVILCEYNLPGNNGLYLYDEFRKEPSLSKTPFILLVDEHSDKVFKTAFSKGVNDYFVHGSTPPEQILLRANQLKNNSKKDLSAKTTPEKKVTYKFPLSKRIFDIVVASSILLVLSPILLLIILAIRLESKGKVYYIAKRVGNRTFDFYKLRSMREGSDKLLKQLAAEKNQYNKPEETGKVKKVASCPRCAKLPAGEYCSTVKYHEGQKICDYWYTQLKLQEQNESSSFIKIVDDPRITRVGKFIRNTSIDELPQLINVIKGDMSLVGNRPLPVYEAELLTQDQMSKRFLAPAGITGLWQVELRGKGGDMSEEERISLDNKYADYFTGNNYSFWFDIGILLRTVPALFQKSTV